MPKLAASFSIATRPISVALCLFFTFVALSNAQEPLGPKLNRNLTVESTLLEPVADAVPPENMGLFIGVNDFTKDANLSRLQFAVNDAVELAYVFVFELKLIPAKNCTLLLSGTPTGRSVEQHLKQLRLAEAVVSTADRSEILSRLEKLRSIPAKDSSLLVCSVSSHGFIVDGRPYVMPSDGLKSRLKYTAVELDLVEDDMEQSKAGNRLLFVDACQERVAAKAIGAAVVGQEMDAAFKQAFQKATGQYKLASCSPKQLSYEFATLGNVGHGVFTFALLEALRGGAAADGENLVRLKSVEDFVSTYLAKWSRDKNMPAQTPFAAGAMTARDMPLARKAGDLATLVASVQRRPLDETFTVELRERLVAVLKNLDWGKVSDRELALLIREFANGTLPTNVFAPYLRDELDRRQPRSVIENSIRTKLVLITSGEFLMGSLDSDTEADEDERPQHRVRLNKSYYLGKYEVTQREWKEVMETEPWKGKEFVKEGDRFPATYVSWEDAVEFCQRLSSMPEEKSKARLYRLPTEAEWEYGCRGVGNEHTRYHFGNEEEDLVKYAWYRHDRDDDNEQSPRFVGEKRPNLLGLHDMHGNVWEWCSDWHASDYYMKSPTNDPQGPSDGSYRVYRGGGWSSAAEGCRTAYRFRLAPTHRGYNGGFRMVMSISETPANKSGFLPTMGSDSTP
jgi:formylglycine-generating enzyme required for sulfatase activity/uncharacterized caspase-like protein